MASDVARIIEQRGDWLDEVPPDALIDLWFGVPPPQNSDEPDRDKLERLRSFIRSTSDVDDIIEQVLAPPAVASYGGLTEAFLDELHAFLCPSSSNDAYKEERKKLVDEYKLGQTTFAASVSAALVPVLGAGFATQIAAGVAVTFTLIGRIGLNAWCAAQKDRISDKLRPDNAERDGGPPAP